MAAQVEGILRWRRCRTKMTGRLNTRCCDPSGIGRSRMYPVPGGVASLNHRLIAAIPPGSNDVRPNARDFA